MKTIKRICIILIIVVGIALINGCYFVFHGQHIAANKLSNRQELNLYEIASTYTMHLAICTAGWIFSPEATIQQILMTFPHKDVVVFKNKKVSSEFKEHPSGMICYSEYNIKNLRFAAALNGTFKTESYIYAKMQYPYQLYPTYILGIPIYEGLFRYLQDRNILYVYEFRYILL